MIDSVALNEFLTGTAFLYAYETAGAVIAIGILLILFKTFRDYILGNIPNG